jgi:hypothetical protein
MYSVTSRGMNRVSTSLMRWPEDVVDERAIARFATTSGVEPPR